MMVKEYNKRRKLFCGLFSDRYGNVLYTNPFEWDLVLKQGQRLVILTHKEHDFINQKFSGNRYRMFVDTPDEQLPGNQFQRST